MLAEKVSDIIFFLLNLFPNHHDSGDANAHVANDVEFAVEEILDAAFTILQSNNTWWGFRWLVSTGMGEWVGFNYLRESV